MPGYVIALIVLGVCVVIVLTIVTIAIIRNTKTSRRIAGRVEQVQDELIIHHVAAPPPRLNAVVKEESQYDELKPNEQRSQYGYSIPQTCDHDQNIGYEMPEDSSGYIVPVGSAGYIVPVDSAGYSVPVDNSRYIVPTEINNQLLQSEQSDDNYTFPRPYGQAVTRQDAESDYSYPRPLGDNYGRLIVNQEAGYLHAID